MLIGELSSRSGVSQRSLRHYEAKGLLRAERAANGYRDYAEDAVQRAATIHLLFGLGFTREVVTSVLSCTGDVAPEVHQEVARRLGPVYDDLRERVERLTRTRDELAAFLETHAPPAG